MAADDLRWMEIALEEARRGGDAGEVPVGAVVVLDGRELGRAHNAPIGLCDPSAHAEVLALRNAACALGAYRLPGATLYATVEPCALCMGAVLQARIARVVFATPDPKAGACGSVIDLSAVPALNHRVDVERGPLGAASAALLQSFFRARRPRAAGRGEGPAAATPSAGAVATDEDER